MDVRENITALLDQIESERELRILYACESGSRAWGFASSDSDWDVRFIYVRPLREYLRLRPPADAFDLPPQGDIDAAGWDIRKAAELLRKSNPPLLEWIDSAIVYRDVDGFQDELSKLRAVYFDPKKAVYHYLSMARNIWKDHLEGVARPVRKKYLYALRPLACIRFIEEYGQQPPTTFTDVLDAIHWPAEVQDCVDRLVEQKKSAAELGAAPADDVLDAHIAAGLMRGEGVAEAAPPNHTSTEQLDSFIVRHIGA